MTTNKTQTALVLQGGGAIGAYHLGVIKRLYETPDFHPDIITGVSIGAFTAAVLAGPKNGDPVAQLEAMWRDFTVSSPFLTQAGEQAVSAVTNFGMYRPRMDYWNMSNWTSLYSTEPLRHTLEKHIDFDKLNSSSVAFAVSALNVTSGQVHYFRNQDGQKIQLDDIVASGSLPPGLPMTHIDGNDYWDGGLFDNTPLQPALEYLDTNPKIKKRVIVVNLFPRQGRTPQNFQDVFERMTELQFSDRLRADVDRLRHHNVLRNMLQEIDPKKHKALHATSPELQMAQNLAHVHDIVEITNETHEEATGATDFSSESIERRIAAGYHDADQKLSQALAA